MNRKKKEEDINEIDQEVVDQIKGMHEELAEESTGRMADLINSINIESNELS